METDQELVERLQGALRVVIRTLEDATPEVIEKLRQDEWRIEVSVGGVHINRRVADSLSGAGDQMAVEIDEFLKWSE